MADLYANYAQLAAARTEGVDYTRTRVEVPGAVWASVAVHGGSIEPGSGEVARAVAGSRMSYYEFAGIMSSGNADLHITSTNFDEPIGAALIRTTPRTLSFHGYTGTTGVAETAVGGLDTASVALVTNALRLAGFTVVTAASEIAGTDPANICNRNQSGAGVQLEMSRAQREVFFPGGDLSRAMRDSGQRTATFSAYVAAVQSIFPAEVPAGTGIRPPYRFIAEVAPGADPGASPSTWAFTGDGIRWRSRAGIKIENGRDDEAGEVEAGSADITFDDRSGKLSPRNVLGEWYGRIGVNTPMRVTLLTIADTFTRTVPSGLGTEPRSGATWQHVTPSLWSVNGSAAVTTLSAASTFNTAFIGDPVGPDIDVTHSASISAMPTGGAWVHATMVRRRDTAHFYRAHTEFQPDGTIVVKIQRVRAGSTTTLTSNVVTGYTFTAGTVVRTRVRSIGRTILIKAWTGATEPAGWQCSVADDAVDGSGFGFYEWRLATNAGALSVTIDDVEVRSTVFCGQVPEWPVRWPSKSGVDVIAPVVASGILRWLKQGQPPLASPISQQLAAYNPQAYWELKDGSSATAAGSSVPYGFPALGTDVTFGNADAPGGALGSVSLNTVASSRLAGVVRSWNLGNGDAGVILYARFPSLPAASPARPLLEIRTIGDIRRWVVTCDAATFNLTAYDAGNNDVGSTGGNVYGIDPTKWFALHVEMNKSGTSDTAFAISWHQVGSQVFYGPAGTVPGRLVTRISDVILTAPVDGTLVSNVWVGPSSVPFVDNTFMAVSSGFSGETDVARIRRVFGYAGIEVAVAPGAGRRLGPQPRNATALEVARDAEKAGYGVLYERGSILGYLPWSARINVPVALALDWAQGHLDEPPEPTDDDQRIVNRWTSSRPDGSERTAENAASIAANRLYADGDEVNVQTDDQLDDDAGWHVAVGTVGDMRWPRIKINLTRNPGLIPQWLGCRVGSRVTVANAPRQILGEVIDLIIEGFTIEVNVDYEWTVEMACSPAKPWTQVGTWGVMRWDAGTSELAEDITLTETLWDIRARTYEDTWASAGGYSWNVNGEILPVTSVTAPVQSGGYWTQTATVVRGSALAKTHAPGEPIHLAEPRRWGMSS